MGKRSNNNRGVRSSVNPQGISPDAEAAREPKSKLEQAAKKSNTR
jgi:small acid-soluble spore protein L (minor)